MIQEIKSRDARGREHEKLVGHVPHSLPLSLSLRSTAAATVTAAARCMCLPFGRFGTNLRPVFAITAAAAAVAGDTLPYIHALHAKEKQEVRGRRGKPTSELTLMSARTRVCWVPPDARERKWSNALAVTLC